MSGTVIVIVDVEGQSVTSAAVHSVLLSTSGQNCSSLTSNKAGAIDPCALTE